MRISKLQNRRYGQLISSLSLLCVCATSPVFAAPYPAPPTESPESWYAAGEEELQQALVRTPNKRRAKNVILFIGDGMGISTVTAARIYDGQQQGHSGEENSLSFEKLPYAALSKTYNTNQQTPDSAGTMTAMMTGVKTKAGFISVNQNAEGGNCKSAAGNELPTFLEQAETIGMSTGVVSTARITHATPAVTYAHVPNRNWEDDADMPQEAKTQGCTDIAAQLIDFDIGNGIEVALGGGRASFLPDPTPDNDKDESDGNRLDGRNLTQEWLAKYDNSAYVTNKNQLNKIDLATTDHLLGLFNPSHMQYDEDRLQTHSNEPSLSLMTEKAIRLLQKNRKGFFLMVEAGRIDHGHHAGSAQRALQDAREFSNAVQKALDMIDLKNTLVIVTADHSHTFTIAGYPTRGNPILGKVFGNDAAGNPKSTPSLAQDKLPYTTLGYRNGRGFAVDLGGDARYNKPTDAGRHDLSDVDTEDHNFHQEALIPLSSESHSAEDVAIFAGGPWAHLFTKVHEQNYIYHVMRYAAKIDKKR